MDSCAIKITESAIKNRRFDVRRCGLEFFPTGILGGSTKAHLGKEILLRAQGLSYLVKTDIPTDAKTGKPRWFFRERSWFKEFIRQNNLMPGDSVVIRRLRNRNYEIVPKKRKLTFIDLFAGIGGTRLAFEKAGCGCVFSSEWYKFAQQTYKANFGENIIKITPCGAG